MRNDTGETAAWAERIRALNDDRVIFQPYTPAIDQPAVGVVKLSLALPIMRLGMEVFG